MVKATPPPTPAYLCISPRAGPPPRASSKAFSQHRFCHFTPILFTPPVPLIVGRPSCHGRATTASNDVTPSDPPHPSTLNTQRHFTLDGTSHSTLYMDFQTRPTFAPRAAHRTRIPGHRTDTSAPGILDLLVVTMTEAWQAHGALARVALPLYQIARMLGPRASPMRPAAHWKFRLSASWLR